jgi:hypothetical protein
MARLGISFTNGLEFAVETSGAMGRLDSRNFGINLGLSGVGFRG